MRRRSGFTLVEVLVAMALILFIMTILAAAFGAATQAVGDFKAAADLAERLRGAATMLKRDLQADHFTDGPQNGPRLSDPNFWNRLNDPINSPPAGFFRIYEGQPDVQEGGPTVADLDNIPSFYQTTTALHYTMALRGSRRGDFLSALVPNGSPLLSNADPLLGPPDARYQDTASVYSSQYAEAIVFLVRTGDVTDGATGVPLFSLNRRQFLTVPNGWMTNVPQPVSIEMSQMPSNQSFNSIRSLSLPINRFEMASPAVSPAGLYANGATRYTTMGEDNPSFRAADVVMSDVVSFDVRILLSGDTEFRDLFDPAVQAFNNGNLAFYSAQNNPNGPAVFDTWSNQKDPNSNTDYGGWQTPKTATSVPLPIIIKAIQISLRVWDFKTKKTRQVTIVQQM